MSRCPERVNSDPVWMSAQMSCRGRLMDLRSICFASAPSLEARQSRPLAELFRTGVESTALKSTAER